MNKGIKSSNGNWLYFLGTDDTLKTKDVLYNVASNLNTELDLLIGKISYTNKIFTSSWSALIWIKHTAHHQSLFYNRKLFKSNIYDDSFKVLADYDYNLQLFLKGIKVKKISTIIADCGTKGVSKKYNWSLYKEEIRLKVKSSSSLLQPVFFLLVSIKSLFRKI